MRNDPSPAYRPLTCSLASHVYLTAEEAMDAEHLHIAGRSTLTRKLSAWRDMGIQGLRAAHERKLLLHHVLLHHLMDTIEVGLPLQSDFLTQLPTPIRRPRRRQSS